MAKFNPSVLDYLGKLGNGVLVLISIVYQEKYYEATFFYTADQMLLTISEELESDLGYDIKQDPEYMKLIEDIIKRVTPFNEMINRIDPIDFSKWTKELEEEFEDQSEVEYLSDNKIEKDQNNESSSSS